MFYDFETYLDENKKHEVNYAVLQDFNGNEWTFNNIDDFCVHTLKKKNKDDTFIHLLLTMPEDMTFSLS